MFSSLPSRFSRTSRAFALATVFFVVLILTMLLVSMLSLQKTRKQSLLKQTDKIASEFAIDSAIEACLLGISLGKGHWGQGTHDDFPRVIRGDLGAGVGYSIEVLPMDTTTDEIHLSENQSYMNFTPSRVELVISREDKDGVALSPERFSLPSYTGLLVIDAQVRLERPERRRVLVGSLLRKHGLRNVIALSGGDGIYSRDAVALSCYEGVQEEVDGVRRNVTDPAKIQEFLESYLRTGTHETMEAVRSDATVYLNSSEGKVGWGDKLSLAIKKRWEEESGFEKEDAQALFSAYNFPRLSYSREDDEEDSKDPGFDLKGEVRIYDRGKNVSAGLLKEEREQKTFSIKEGATELAHPFGSLNLAKMVEEVGGDSSSVKVFPSFERADAPPIRGGAIATTADSTGLPVTDLDLGGPTSTTPPTTTTPSTPKKISISTFEKGRTYYVKPTSDQGSLIEGNINLNGAKLYVEGDLEIKGQFMGKGTVYVNGSTTIRGDVDLTSSQDEVALFSKEDIRILKEPFSSSLSAYLEDSGSSVSSEALTRLDQSISGLKSQADHLSKKEYDKLKALRTEMKTALTVASSEKFFSKEDYRSLMDALAKKRRAYMEEESFEQSDEVHELMRSVGAIMLVTDREFVLNDREGVATYFDSGKDLWPPFIDTKPLKVLDEALERSLTKTLRKGKRKKILKQFSKATPDIGDNRASFKGLLCSQEGSVVSQMPLSVLGMVVAEEGFIAAGDLTILSDSSVLSEIYLENMGTYDILLWLP